MKSDATSYVGHIPSTWGLSGKVFSCIGPIAFIFYGPIMLLAYFTDESGVAFGFLLLLFIMFAFGGSFLMGRTYKRMYQNMTILSFDILEVDEKILYVSPTMFRIHFGSRTWGYLIITNKKISYRPSGYMGDHWNMDFPLSSVIDVQRYIRYLYPQGLSLVLKSGAPVKFRVLDGAGLEEKIRSGMRLNATDADQPALVAK